MKSYAEIIAPLKNIMKELEDHIITQTLEREKLNKDKLEIETKIDITQKEEDSSKKTIKKMKKFVF